MLARSKGSARQCRRKGSELYVQPAELARKLVKEMEDHKVSRPTGVSVRNRYTIFLCPEDYERVRGRTETLADKLERHLAKHARAKKYDLPGDLSVDIVADVDLKLGHFGILAERDAPGLAEQDLPASAPRPRTERPRPAQPARPAAAPSAPNVGMTAVISPADAQAFDLAWQTIVLRAGDCEREFTKGRVIVGRARDADFRIDDANVSRHHAAIFWADGNVVLEDLGSTNGTMVNGYPVSSTVIREGDVVVIGDCRIVIETR